MESRELLSNELKSVASLFVEWQQAGIDECPDFEDEAFETWEKLSEGEILERQNAIMSIDDVLEISVKTDWHSIGEECEPTHWKVLLTCGGPNIWLEGEISEHKECTRARLLGAWGSERQEYFITDKSEREAIDQFLQQIYIG